MKNYPRYEPYERRVTPDLNETAENRKKGKMSGGGVPPEDEITPPAHADAVEKDFLKGWRGTTEHAEALTSFENQVDSITGLKLPMKNRHAELKKIVIALERAKKDTEKIDQYFGEGKPAAKYLQEKTNQALAELAQLSMWPE